MEKEYKYMVGVSCMTYNQSKYILDALNGFVMQQTNFPYVVMVVDDASTDGEQEVIRKFVSEQFDTNDTSVAYEKETDYAHITYAQHKTNKNCYIAVLYLKENHYSQRKTKMPYLAEWRDHVKYEALCEGDDYWIHPQKLQMQVDFLEKNEGYGLVYGRAKTYIQEKKEWGKYIGIKKEGFDDLIIQNGIPTLTVMYRKDVLIGYEDFVKEERDHAVWKMGDYPMWLYVSYSYKIYFFDKIFAVYRIIENSASHFLLYEMQKEFLNSVYDVRYFFEKKYRTSYRLNMKFSDLYNHDVFNLAILFNKKKEASLYFFKIQNKTIKEILKYILFVILPFKLKR